MKIMNEEEIKEIIDGAGSAILALGENPGEQDFLVREVLRIFFQNKGALVYLLPETPQDLKNKWLPILNSNNYENPALSSEIFVRLPKNRFDVKEIGYEEDSDFLTLKITASDNENQKNDIALDIKPATFDVLICFGSPDVNLDNLNFRNRILLKAGEKTLSEKVFEIVDGGVSPNILFASLLLETNIFKKNITEGSLNLGQKLLSLNADKKIIDEILNSELSLSFAQILGRALARTRFSESSQGNWTFISKNDAQRAGIPNIDAPLIRRIGEEIRNIVSPQPTFIILWENMKNEVWATITTERNGERQAGPHKSFTEAELAVKQTLKEIS